MQPAADHDERGIALLSVATAVFIVAVVVAAMAVATMGESVQTHDQLRGQQALAVAEAGAYRALAELRRRLSVDLDLHLSQAPAQGADLRDICAAAGAPPRERVESITGYAWPPSAGSTDWERAGGTGILRIGAPAARIGVSGPTAGTVVGDFYAVVAVRDSGAPASCRFGADGPEQAAMFFDYAILSIGRSGTAARAVCLRSPFADRCGRWFPMPDASWQGSYTRSGGAYAGVPVVIERASYAQWALAVLSDPAAWLYSGAEIRGPLHVNTRLWIAGNPSLDGPVTQVEGDMRFYACGDPVTLVVPSPPVDPNAALRTAGCDNTLGTVFLDTVAGRRPAVAAPADPNPSRVSVGLSPAGPNATDAEVRRATSELPDLALPVPNGAYVADECGAAGCGGIYVRGNVTRLTLAAPGGRQEITVSIEEPADPTRALIRYVIDPRSMAITAYWGPNWSLSRSWPAGTFNGIIHVSGTIRAGSDPGTPSGVYGIVQRDMRLTIAVEGEIRITDHLVYEAPPAGVGHAPANVLGLHSTTGNVTIVGALVPDDLFIDAAVLAPAGRFWVEGWNTLARRGTVFVLGSAVQGALGPFGGFSPETGFGRRMTHDWRLRSTVWPPFFPRMAGYGATRRSESSMALAGGDPLYDPPQWEETTVP